MGEGELQLRSTKKPKMSDSLGIESEEMEVQQLNEEKGEHRAQAVMTWANQCFSNQMRTEEFLEEPVYYMGEDDEEKYERVDELFRYCDNSEDRAPLYRPRLEISKEKYTSLFRKWRGALIIKLLGKSISYRILEQCLRDIWRLEKWFELTDLEEGFFIVQFFARADYMLVLEGGPWVILGHYLTVTRWRPMFKPAMETMKKTLVWVRFPGIWPEFLDEEILTQLGDMVGKTIKVDKTSLTGIRGKFGRCCVEVDLSAPLLPSLTVFEGLKKWNMRAST